MTDEEAQAFVRRWWGEVWHDGDLGVAGELFADTYVQHSARGNVTLTGREFQERLVQYQRVLHRPTTTVDDLAVIGDKVWMRATSKGVNLETNEASCVTWMACYRFEGGRVAEGWVATVPDVDWRKAQP